MLSVGLLCMLYAQHTRVKQQLGAGQGMGKRAGGILRPGVGVRAAKDI